MTTKRSPRTRTQAAEAVTTGDSIELANCEIRLTLSGTAYTCRAPSVQEMSALEEALRQAGEVQAAEAAKAVEEKRTADPMHHLYIDWWKLIFTALEVNANPLPSEVPSWLVSSALASEVMLGWREVPYSGGKPTDRLSLRR